uniref:Putative secreted protein n=1 Tax=Anopheles darlingi TaxID=43151 RepID=A0A2M4D9E4_ANODA
MTIFGPCFRASTAVVALTSSIVSALHSRPAISFGTPPAPFTYRLATEHLCSKGRKERFASFTSTILRTGN